MSKFETESKEKLLTSNEAAKYLSTTLFKLKRWVSVGTIKPYSRVGKSNALRFRKKDLDWFIENVTEEQKKKRKKYVLKNPAKKRRKRRWWKKPLPKPTARIYHILMINHDKQLQDIYQGPSLELVYKRFRDMVSSNKVLFPVRYNVEGSKVVEAKYELIIIKKRDESDNDVTMLQNEYGKFIPYRSSDDRWVIYDKEPYDMEETFWVYGYHPSLQRKNTQWIYDEIVSKAPNDKYEFRMVYVFKNKLLVESSKGLDMVICKNKSDCVRLYNLIEELCTKNKVKFVGFGSDLDYSKHKKQWFDKIEELTGWSRKKIGRNTTRP